MAKKTSGEEASKAASAKPKLAAKKTSSGEKAEASAPKAAPRAKKPHGPARGSGGATGLPSIDTNLAAQAAAKMLSAGIPSKNASGASGSKTESSMFKQLKQGLSRSHLTGMADVLEKSALPGNKKPNLPSGRNEQVGHNQTFGADVNRAGVPRRTPG
jgi:hypothetical protein